ncbi:uncharacterized protein LOC144449013 [Glandiceps talaboti]
MSKNSSQDTYDTSSVSNTGDTDMGSKCCGAKSSKVEPNVEEMDKRPSPSKLMARNRGQTSTTDDVDETIELEDFVSDLDPGIQNGNDYADTEHTGLESFPLLEQNTRNYKRPSVNSGSDVDNELAPLMLHDESSTVFVENENAFATEALMNTSPKEGAVERTYLTTTPAINGKAATEENAPTNPVPSATCGDFENSNLVNSTLQMQSSTNSSMNSDTNGNERNAILCDTYSEKYQKRAIPVTISGAIIGHTLGKQKSPGEMISQPSKDSGILETGCGDARLTSGNEITHDKKDIKGEKENSGKEQRDESDLSFSTKVDIEQHEESTKCVISSDKGEASVARNDNVVTNQSLQSTIESKPDQDVQFESGSQGRGKVDEDDEVDEVDDFVNAILARVSGEGEKAQSQEEKLVTPSNEKGQEEKVAPPPVPPSNQKAEEEQSISPSNQKGKAQQVIPPSYRNEDDGVRSTPDMKGQDFQDNAENNVEISKSDNTMEKTDTDPILHAENQDGNDNDSKVCKNDKFSKESGMNSILVENMVSSGNNVDQGTGNERMSAVPTGSGISECITVSHETENIGQDMTATDLGSQQSSEIPSLDPGIYEEPINERKVDDGVGEVVEKVGELIKHINDVQSSAVVHGDENINVTKENRNTCVHVISADEDETKNRSEIPNEDKQADDTQSDTVNPGMTDMGSELVLNESCQASTGCEQQTNVLTAQHKDHESSNSAASLDSARHTMSEMVVADTSGITGMQEVNEKRSTHNDDTDETNDVVTEFPTTCDSQEPRALSRENTGVDDADDTSNENTSCQGNQVQKCDTATIDSNKPGLTESSGTSHTVVEDLNNMANNSTQDIISPVGFDNEQKTATECIETTTDNRTEQVEINPTKNRTENVNEDAKEGYKETQLEKDLTQSVRAKDEIIGIINITKDNEHMHKDIDGELKCASVVGEVTAKRETGSCVEVNTPKASADQHESSSETQCGDESLTENVERESAVQEKPGNSKSSQVFDDDSNTQIDQSERNDGMTEPQNSQLQSPEDATQTETEPNKFEDNISQEVSDLSQPPVEVTSKQNEPIESKDSVSKEERYESQSPVKVTITDDEPTKFEEESDQSQSPVKVVSSEREPIKSEDTLSSGEDDHSQSPTRDQSNEESDQFQSPIKATSTENEDKIEDSVPKEESDQCKSPVNVTNSENKPTKSEDNVCSEENDDAQFLGKVTSIENEPTQIDDSVSKEESDQSQTYAIVISTNEEPTKLADNMPEEESSQFQTPVKVTCSEHTPTVVEESVFKEESGLPQPFIEVARTENEDKIEEEEENDQPQSPVKVTSSKDEPNEVEDTVSKDENVQSQSPVEVTRADDETKESKDAVSKDGNEPTPSLVEEPVAEIEPGKSTDGEYNEDSGQSKPLVAVTCTEIEPSKFEETISSKKSPFPEQITSADNQVTSADNQINSADNQVNSADNSVDNQVNNSKESDEKSGKPECPVEMIDTENDPSKSEHLISKEECGETKASTPCKDQSESSPVVGDGDHQILPTVEGETENERSVATKSNPTDKRTEIEHSEKSKLENDSDVIPNQSMQIVENAATKDDDATIETKPTNNNASVARVQNKAIEIVISKCSDDNETTTDKIGETINETVKTEENENDVTMRQHYNNPHHGEKRRSIEIIEEGFVMVVTDADKFDEFDPVRKGDILKPVRLKNTHESTHIPQSTKDDSLESGLTKVIVGEEETKKNTENPQESKIRTDKNIVENRTVVVPASDDKKSILDEPYISTVRNQEGDQLSSENAYHNTTNPTKTAANEQKGSNEIISHENEREGTNSNLQALSSQDQDLQSEDDHPPIFLEFEMITMDRVENEVHEENLEFFEVPGQRSSRREVSDNPETLLYGPSPSGYDSDREESSQQEAYDDTPKKRRRKPRKKRENSRDREDTAQGIDSKETPLNAKLIALETEKWLPVREKAPLDGEETEEICPEKTEIIDEKEQKCQLGGAIKSSKRDDVIEKKIGKVDNPSRSVKGSKDTDKSSISNPMSEIKVDEKENLKSKDEVADPSEPKQMRPKLIEKTAGEGKMNNTKKKISKQGKQGNPEDKAASSKVSSKDSGEKASSTTKVSTGEPKSQTSTSKTSTVKEDTAKTEKSDPKSASAILKKKKKSKADEMARVEKGKSLEMKGDPKPAKIGARLSRETNAVRALAQLQRGVSPSETIEQDQCNNPENKLPKGARKKKKKKSTAKSDTSATVANPEVGKKAPSTTNKQPVETMSVGVQVGDDLAALSAKRVSVRNSAVQVSMVDDDDTVSEMSEDRTTIDSEKTFESTDASKGLQQSGKYVTEFPYPARSIPKLIGRKGKNIRQIAGRTGTIITNRPSDIKEFHIVRVEAEHPKQLWIAMLAIQNNPRRD